MAVDRVLTDLTLAEFGERLAARTATPGGGSVAAHLTSIGTALVTMAFRFTSGDKYAAFEPAMAHRVEELERLRARALELVDQDSAAYDAVTAAYKLPKTSEPEKLARTQAVQAALVHAMEVPSATMELALAGLMLCAAGAPDINPNLASDCATGAMCLSSALESAFLNVKINAASLHDKQRASQQLARCEGWRAEAHSLAASVRTAVEQKLS